MAAAPPMINDLAVRAQSCFVPTALAPLSSSALPLCPIHCAPKSAQRYTTSVLATCVTHGLARCVLPYACVARVSGPRRCQKGGGGTILGTGMGTSGLAVSLGRAMGDATECISAFCAVMESFPTFVVVLGFEEDGVAGLVVAVDDCWRCGLLRQKFEGRDGMLRITLRCARRRSAGIPDKPL